MRTIGTIDQVAAAYAGGEPEPHQSGNRALYVENGILMSYGEPVGRLVTGDEIRPANERRFLVNIDGVSTRTWNRQPNVFHGQALIAKLDGFRWNRVHEGPPRAIQVSARLLDRHNVDFRTTKVIVVSVTEDINRTVRNYNTEDVGLCDGPHGDEIEQYSVQAFEDFEKNIKAEFGALGRITTDEADNRWIGYRRTGPSATDKEPVYKSFTEKSFHLAGGSLILATDREGNFKLLWSAQDGWQYFCCELNQDEYCAVERDRPELDRLAAAQLSLMPADLRDRTDVARQGEYFFAPVRLTEPLIRGSVVKWYRLADRKVTRYPNMGFYNYGRFVREDADTAHHSAHFAMIRGEGLPLVAGFIKDRQHGYLMLQEGSVESQRRTRPRNLPDTWTALSSLTWFEPRHNTQLASYSAESVGIRID